MWREYLYLEQRESALLFGSCIDSCCESISMNLFNGQQIANSQADFAVHRSSVLSYGNVVVAETILKRQREEVNAKLEPALCD